MDRPVADVFANVSALTTFPGWNPTTVSATRITEGDIGLGTRFQMKIRGFGDHVLEMNPEGIFMLMWPKALLMPKRNLGATARALHDHLESRGNESAASDG